MVARDGAEAHEYLLGEDAALNGERRLVPKVIFLDLKMPQGRRLQAARRTCAQTSARREVPVVIVTSSDREVDVKESYRLGANSFVVKQFDPDKPGEYLVDIARYWLDLNRVGALMAEPGTSAADRADRRRRRRTIAASSRCSCSARASRRALAGSLAEARLKLAAETPRRRADGPEAARR